MLLSVSIVNVFHVSALFPRLTVTITFITRVARYKQAEFCW